MRKINALLVMVGVVVLCLVVLLVSRSSAENGGAAKASNSYLKGRGLLLFFDTAKILLKEEVNTINDYISKGKEVQTGFSEEKRLIVLLNNKGKWIEVHSVSKQIDVHDGGKVKWLRVSPELHKYLETLAKKKGMVID